MSAQKNSRASRFGNHVVPPMNATPVPATSVGWNSSMSTPFGTTATRAAGAMRCSTARSCSETATLSATRSHQSRSTLSVNRAW